MKNSNTKSYRDLGLTEEDFLELVNFFRELMRLDQRGTQRDHLVRVFRERLQKLIVERESTLIDQLRELEKMKRRF